MRYQRPVRTLGNLDPGSLRQNSKESESRLIRSFWNGWGDFLEDGELERGPESCVRFRKRAREAHSNRGNHEQAQGKEGLARTRGQAGQTTVWEGKEGEHVGAILHPPTHPPTHPSAPPPSLQ